MAHWVGPKSQVNLAKNSKTSPHYDVTPRKLQTPNQIFFFNLNYKTCGIRRVFEQLFSSILRRVVTLQTLQKHWRTQD